MQVQMQNNLSISVTFHVVGRNAVGEGESGGEISHSVFEPWPLSD